MAVAVGASIAGTARGLPPQLARLATTEAARTGASVCRRETRLRKNMRAIYRDVVIQSNGLPIVGTHEIEELATATEALRWGASSS